MKNNYKTLLLILLAGVVILGGGYMMHQSHKKEVKVLQQQLKKCREGKIATPVRTLSPAPRKKYPNHLPEEMQ